MSKQNSLHIHKRPLQLLLVSLLSSVIMGSSSLMDVVAQSSTLTPTITSTYVPVTLAPTLIPSPTSTPIPTLTGVIRNREVINLGNIHQIVKLRAWTADNNFGVNTLVFSPTSSDLLAVGDSLAVDPPPFPAHRWQIEGDQVELREAFFKTDPQYRISTLKEIKFSADGTRIIAAGEAGVLVWDAETGDLIAHVNQVGALTATLGANNESLIVGGAFGLITRWQIHGGIPTWPSEMGGPPVDYVYDPEGALQNAWQVDESIVQVEYDANSHHIFALTSSGKLHLFKLLNEFGVEHTVILPSVRYFSRPETVGSNIGGPHLALLPNSQRVAYVGGYRNVVIYDYQNSLYVYEYANPNTIMCIASNPDGTLLLVGDWTVDGIILRLIDTATQAMIAVVHTGQSVISCAFNADGTLIAAGSLTGEISLWGVP